MIAFASALSEQPGQTVRRDPGKAHPMAVWEKYGLLSPRLVSARAGDARFASLPRETRFRMALEEAGGLFVIFGRYLAGRADLLPSPHLRQLSRIRIRRELSLRSIVDRELGGRVSGLQPLRTTVGCDFFRAEYRGSPVIVEAYRGRARDDAARKALNSFRREIRSLEDGVEGRIAAAVVLQHFDEWLRLQHDLERKRMVLENLEHTPAISLCRYPRLVGEIQSPNCLVYEAMEGKALEVESDRSREAAVRQLGFAVEGLLDQSLFLSLIDADSQFENYLSLPCGHLGFETVPALSPVPVEWNYELLQYMACTAARNSPRALHMLARISSNENPYAGEHRLMRELSGLQPELKINLVTPETVTALENYWRALSHTHMIAPLFLELFHRQWTIVGQINGDIAPSSDLIADALWPVISRILRLRFSDLMSMEKAREWIGSTGLLALGAARQLGMTLEEMRDDDLGIVVDHQRFDDRDAILNRRTVSLVRSGLAFAAFLLMLHLALSLQGIGVYRIAAGLAAVISAVVLAVFIAKIE